MTSDFLAEPIVVTLKDWSSHHKHTFLAKSVVVALKHWSCHPKVGEFDCSAGVDQAVPKYIISIRMTITKMIIMMMMMMMGRTRS